MSSDGQVFKVSCVGCDNSDNTSVQDILDAELAYCVINATAADYVFVKTADEGIDVTVVLCRGDTEPKPIRSELKLDWVRVFCVSQVCVMLWCWPVWTVDHQYAQFATEGYT